MNPRGFWAVVADSENLAFCDRMLRALRVVILSSLSTCCLAGGVYAQPVFQEERADALPLDSWQKSLHQGSLDSRRAASQQTYELALKTQVALLPDFIDLLRHEHDGQIRLALFETLTRMGPAAAEAVPALVNAMRQDFGGRRNEELHQNFRAALALASIGPAAVENLRNLLVDKSDALRAEAAMALGKIGAPAGSAVSDLVLLLNDESARVRQDAIAALGNIGVLDPLWVALENEKVVVRAGAIEALGIAAANEPEVIDLVLRALIDEAPEVRAAASRLFGIVEIPPGNLRQALLNGLQDSEENVRGEAVNFLTKHHRVLSELKDELVSLLVVENDDVAWVAAFLLQELGAESVQTLLAAAPHPNARIDQLARAIALVGGGLEELLYKTLQKKGEPRSQQVAALALGLIRPLKSETVGVLTTALKTMQPDQEVAFLTAISSLDSRAASAIPAVRDLKRHPNREVRRIVVEILTQAATRNAQLREDLEEFVHDEEFTIQRLAIDSLRKLGPLGESAMELVIGKVASQDKNVRVATLAFLGSHGGAAGIAVPHLRQELAQESSSEWRIAVLETLGEIGVGAQLAFADIADAFRDTSPDVRVASLKTLSSLRMDIEKLAPYLLQAMVDSDESVRSQGASSVRRLGATASQLVPGLLELLLQTSDEAIKENIERLLDRLERYQTDSAAIPALLMLTNQDNVRVQQRAIRMLGLAGTDAKTVLPRLQSFLKHDVEALREEAVQAIGNLRKND
jgi:HEAT repeat protein